MYIKKQTKQRKAERKYLSFYKPKTTVNILRNMQFRAQKYNLITHVSLISTTKAIIQNQKKNFSSVEKTNELFFM